MKKIIYNLRSKSEQTRRHILHVSTIIAGVILLFLWIFSLGTNFSNPDTQTKASNDLKPFSTLKANLVDGYNSISQ